MLKLLTCPQGHYWEKPIEDGADGQPEVCPVCGQTAETMPLLDLAPTEVAPPSPAGPPAPLPLRDKNGWPVVAGYELLQDLGKGPTGVHLYRARQLLVNRLVTLKVVFAGDDPGQLAWGSLRNEASALGRMAHPNIVQVLEAGERDRQLFYNAIEHVDGPTLAEALAGKPLPIRQAISLVETLARAMQHAHEKKILHRNLKPASILLQKKDEGGRMKDEKQKQMLLLLLHPSSFLPKITDFGLARRPVEGDTSDAELQGERPRYLSPEQAWGRAKEIGPATDIYALGAIFHELLTGQPPFRADSAAETLDAIQCREVPPLSRLRRRVPRDLDTICRKCLAKQPRRRYASALELAEDLRRCAEGYPIKARSASAAERFGKWLRRNFRTVALVLLGLWAALSVLALTLSSDSDSARTARQQVNHGGAVNRLENELLQARRRESTGSYLSNLLLAEREARDGDPVRAREYLDRCPVDQRMWEWYYLRNQLREANDNKMVFLGGGPATSVDFSPDGQYLAVGGVVEHEEKARSAEGEVVVWNLRTRAKVWRATVAAPVRGVAFSPDGSQLALVSSGDKWGDDSEVQVRFAHMPHVVFSRAYRGTQLTTLAYSPNQNQLLVAGGDGVLRTLRADNGVQLHAEQVDFRRAWPPGGLHGRLLPLGDAGGQRLAFLSPDGSQVLILRDLLRPGVNELQGCANTTIRALDYDGRGEMLAAAGSDQAIRLWNMRSPSQPTATLRGHKDAVTGVTFSRNSERLASCGDDGTVRIWEPKEGQELLILTGYKDAAGVLFQSIRDELALNWRDIGMKEVDRLAIMHGNKVTVLSPRP
ncbi:MAG TPA: serine/threonine-protein kinase [Gemmataceae bacterium]|jgi:serine/threonine protein kinase/WD40 repeat protein